MESPITGQVVWTINARCKNLNQWIQPRPEDQKNTMIPVSMDPQEALREMGPHGDRWWFPESFELSNPYSLPDRKVVLEQEPRMIKVVYATVV